MREIKFRAWDLSNKSMYNHKELVDGSVVNPDVLIDCLAKPGNGYDTDTVLMQYTGLKDKNGKEIYEGDIVEIQQPTSINRGEIGFREGAFAFTSQLQVDGNRTIVYLHSVKHQSTWKLEVIGNIYENKELLK